MSSKLNVRWVASASLLSSVCLLSGPLGICSAQAPVLKDNFGPQVEPITDPILSGSKQTLRIDTTLLNDVQRPGRLVVQDAVTPEQKKLYDKFEKLLTGAKLVGMFTVDGRPLDKLSPEEYEISKVEKQPEGDWWTITARIKYGDKDLSVPVPLEVKWAGKTPVLTLDNITLPGFGTFSSRVVLSGDRYAGTWQHDDKGGHLFGKIILPKEKTESK
ncbi:MAG: hypothetical protein U0892_20625 [Pirellulales bacterium]